jgi:Protein of unknown function (DUF3108)
VVSLSHIRRLFGTGLTLLCAGAAAQTEAFGPGEQLVFRASYLGIPAGTIQTTVGAEFADRPGVWPIVAYGRTDVGMFFFPIRDKLVIHWEADQARTLGMELWADENHKRQRLKITFAPAEGTARIVRQWEGQAATEKQVSVGPGVTDVASAVYLLRTRELEPGHELTIPIVTPSKQFPMRAVVQGRERRRTPMGERTVVRVRLTTDFSGKFKAKNDLVLYFTDDEAHVPVRFEAELGLGTVVAELTEYKPGRLFTLRRAAAVRPEVH